MKKMASYATMNRIHSECYKQRLEQICCQRYVYPSWTMLLIKISFVLLHSFCRAFPLIIDISHKNMCIYNTVTLLLTDNCTVYINNYTVNCVFWTKTLNNNADFWNAFKHYEVCFMSTSSKKKKFNSKIDIKIKRKWNVNLTFRNTKKKYFELSMIGLQNIEPNYILVQLFLLVLVQIFG